VPVLNAAQVAQLVKQAGFPGHVHVEMVAIAKAESGFRTDAIGGPNKNQTYDRGVWQINDVHRFDRNRLVRDSRYNAECAKNIFDRQGLRAWSVYNSGAWRRHENEARQGVAQSSSVVGTPDAAGGAAEPAKSGVTYGPPGPQLTIAGIGTPLAAAGVIPGPLQGLQLIGTDVTGDFSTVIIGTPKYSAGWNAVPHLNFTVADPEGGLLWYHQGIWQRGVRVTWQDLDMRIDEITFSPGGHTTGQLEISAIDSIVYALMNLRGERVASGISAVQWLATELQLCGYDPNRCLLGEAVPTQSEIGRDIPDPEGQTGNTEVPSAWTTIVRLAKELGKRVFISGSRIIFGSAAFAMAWSSPGDLHIGWHRMAPGERWHTLPTGKQTSIGNRSGLTEVSGRVPLNRAPFFRPGVSVLVRNTPSIAAAENRQFVVSEVEHDLANDIDGADITLNEPVDPPPQPPTSNEKVNDGAPAAGGEVSGGGADGQIDQFVNLCLRQVGDRYVFGAETRMSDPDPGVFDCCIVGAMLVYTADRGPVPISEIEIGDIVLGCDRDAGNTIAGRPVIAWSRRRPRPIHRVRTRNREVDVTSNHPFLRAVKLPRERDNAGRWRPVEWVFDWTHAGRLTRGDLLVVLDGAAPDPAAGARPTLPDGTEVTEDVAWLFGTITGNGWVSHSGVQVSVLKPDVTAAVRKVFEHVWGRAACWYPDAPERGVIFNSVRVAAMLRGLGYVGKAPTKQVPPVVSTWPHRLIAAYLRGYADTGGHYDKRGHISYSSASRRLISETRALHILLGDAVSNIGAVTQKDVVIRGKQVPGGHLFYSFTYYPDSPRRDVTLLNDYGLRRFLPEPWSVRRVQSVEIVGEDETFDIQVEGTRNFIAEGLVVSNSELIEWAASRVGISPKVPDGSSAQINHCRSIPVAQAIRTKGALLWHSGHIGVSLGNGRTVEAQNPRAGVLQTNAGNRFTRGGLIPGARGYR